MFITRQRRGLTPTIKRELRRRSAIEPMIRHMKADGRLGDAITCSERPGTISE